MDAISGRPEPEGFLVEIVPGERIHFLDWGMPTDAAPGSSPGVLLVHGLSATAWAWAPVARRLQARTHVVAIDLRGHGLSDAPTSGYTADQLAEDVIAAAEGSGLLGEAGSRVVLAGHGYGAIVATWAALALGARCAGLVLVDGGWQDLAAETGLSPEEWLREMAEPPGIFASMGAYLADRRDFDPGSWDADQDRAARSTVVEVPAGKVVSATRPHAVAASVEAMFTYDPIASLGAVAAPLTALLAADEDAGGRAARFAELDQVRSRAGLAPIRRVDLSTAGHNLMRYRPAEVSAAILAAGGEPAAT
jgi:pimeloyl-ACP methyl ester carboxylesterase